MSGPDGVLDTWLTGPKQLAAAVTVWSSHTSMPMAMTVLVAVKVTSRLVA